VIESFEPAIEATARRSFLQCLFVRLFSAPRARSGSMSRYAFDGSCRQHWLNRERFTGRVVSRVFLETSSYAFARTKPSGEPREETHQAFFSCRGPTHFLHIAHIPRTLLFGLQPPVPDA
jgi:hypothetical protein